MNRLYCDSNNVKWMMFDVDKQRGPLYNTPTHTELIECIENHLGMPRCVSRIVSLPYYSVPMWVANENDITSLLNYLYCVCCSCGSTLHTPGQLVIIISLGMNKDQTTSMTWRVGMRGLCCNAHLLDHNIYYPYILSSQKKLISAIETGWSSFDTTNECNGCTHWECKMTDEIIKENHLYTENVVLDQLLWHFFNIKLDVVTPLLYNRCAKSTCGIPLKYAKNRITCDICRKNVYCSEECVEKHHCKAYYLLWI